MEITKTKRLLALTAIFASTIVVMADLVITPVIGLIYGYYPDHVSAVNFIVSGPMLVLVIASLLTPLLFKVMDKKLVFIIGSAIFTVGAIFGVAVDHPLYICFTRALVGVGEGIVNVVGITYIAELYQEQKDRSRITGFYNAALSVAGMVLSYVAGMLAADGVWLQVYKIYWIAIPMLLLVIFLIPSVKPVKKASAAADSEKKVKQKKDQLGWKYWFMTVCWFVINVVLGASILYYLSLYIFENGLGDSTFSGLCIAVKSICGILICIGFGWIMNRCKRYTSTISYAVAAVTLIAMVIMPSKFMALVIGTICGLTYKILFSYNYAHGFEIVPASRTDDAVSITTAVYGVGSFLCTYFATWLMTVMKTDMVTPTWYVIAAIVGVVLVADIIAIAVEKKQEAPMESQTESQ
ncbi:MAG TPA: MFS transporter [Clostridiales bacterium]|nr:MFS transporter [Clostridiales bacterium]